MNFNPVYTDFHETIGCKAKGELEICMFFSFSLTLPHFLHLNAPSFFNMPSSGDLCSSAKPALGILLCFLRVASGFVICLGCEEACLDSPSRLRYAFISPHLSNAHNPIPSENFFFFFLQDFLQSWKTGRSVEHSSVGLPCKFEVKMKSITNTYHLSLKRKHLSFIRKYTITLGNSPSSNCPPQHVYLELSQTSHPSPITSLTSPRSGNGNIPSHLQTVMCPVFHLESQIPL